MRLRTLATAALCVALASLGSESTFAAPEEGAADLAALALTALGDDAAAADSAAKAMRAAGPKGLEALVAALPADGRAQGPKLSGTQAAEEKARRARLAAVVDRVAGQKDARFARLYWHTDEAEAIARAEREGKPILSLRLLGRLDEDCSCANSRFFRTVLYPDPAVSAALRERFVLHWRSMRPVPKVTIDFGDGRVLERPVTGNSAHLVLDPRGRVVDAIPGLLGAAAFLRTLERGEAIAKATADLQDAPRTERLATMHREDLAALDAAWSADATAIGRPDARPEVLEDGEAWAKIAERHRMDAHLSLHSVAVVREKTNAVDVDRRTVSKSGIEAPLVRLLRRLEGGIALDSVRNEQRMHRVVHRWFEAKSVAPTPQPLAERLYADVFLTPTSDPWLGLVSPDEYSALDGAGLHVPSVAPNPTR
jgi:hypothetical protein